VSWDDISKEYLPWLSRRAGEGYRLLTEAEWEYAARAGTTTPYATGATISTDQANYNGNWSYGEQKYWEKTVEVGSYPANPFGLHDMQGNVEELAADCSKDDYSGVPTDGSAFLPQSCDRRVVRGGSWNGLPESLRSARRSSLPPDFRANSVGFRVAKTLNP
jgi:formylglycine-generating enzyme required for sulfatase activity